MEYVSDAVLKLELLELKTMLLLELRLMVFAEVLAEMDELKDEVFADVGVAVVVILMVVEVVFAVVEVVFAVVDVVLIVVEVVLAVVEVVLIDVDVVLAEVVTVAHVVNARMQAMLLIMPMVTVDGYYGDRKDTKQSNNQNSTGHYSKDINTY